MRYGLRWVFGRLSLVPARAPRQILRVPGIHQIYFETGLFQNVVDRNPVHARRLQGDGANSALLQPRGHPSQLRRHAPEPAYRLAVTGRRHGHVMGFVADVDAGGRGMHDVQAEIFSLDFSCELPSLLPIHLMPTTLDRSPYAFSRLLLSLTFHGIPRLVEFNAARPGWRNLHNLSLGVRPRK